MNEDSKILFKAIDKALNNNFKWLELDKDSWELIDEVGRIEVVIQMMETPYSSYCVIFSHEFAKALWGEELYYCDACHRHHDSFADCDCGVGNNQEAWKHHLQQMIIMQHPINYLVDYI